MLEGLRDAVIVIYLFAHTQGIQVSYKQKKDGVAGHSKSTPKIRGIFSES